MNLLSIIADIIAILASVTAIIAAVKAEKARKEIIKIKSLITQGGISFINSTISGNKGHGVNIKDK